MKVVVESVAAAGVEGCRISHVLEMEVCTPLGVHRGTTRKLEKGKLWNILCQIKKTITFSKLIRL